MLPDDMGRRTRRIASTCLFWLVFSYLPAEAGRLPEESAPASPLAGEYELQLTTEAPVHDVLIVQVQAGKDGLALYGPGKALPVPLRPVAGRPLEFLGRAEDGDVLDAPGKPFTVRFAGARPGQGPTCRLANEEVAYSGGRIGPPRLPSARKAPDRTLSVEELRHDLHQLRRLMECVHPALYVFTPRERFDALFAEQEKKLDRPLQAHQFWAVAAPLVAAIGCGHADTRLPEEYFRDPAPGFFPVRLHLAGRRAFAVQSLAPEIPAGAEILAVDGTAMAELVSALSACVTSDGLLESTRRYRLERAFPSLYASAFGKKARFSVRIVPAPGTAPRDVVFPAVAWRELDALQTPRPGKTALERHLRFEPVAGTATAVLTIHSFGFYGDNEGFQRFLDAAFREMQAKAVTDLVLDLRDNDGGDPFCSSYLLCWLSPRPIPYFAQEYGKSYAVLARPLPPVDTPFRGRVWTLVDGGCLSSTTHLCALLKFHQLCRFVGSETAGNYTCNDSSGDFVLSCSGITVRLARRTYAVAVEGQPRDRGIRPDIPVEPSLADIMAGVDTARECAFRAIAREPSVSLLASGKRVIPVYAREQERFWKSDIKLPDLLVRNVADRPRRIEEIRVIGRCGTAETVRLTLGATAVERLAGNYVVIDHGLGEWGFYAHLAEGSITVRTGDTVEAGQIVGRVGNTGNSEEPHLHFQLMDGPDFLSANGLPVRFSDLPEETQGLDETERTTLTGSETIQANQPETP